MILILSKGCSGLFECIFHISNKTKPTDSKKAATAQTCVQRLRVFQYICSFMGLVMQMFLMVVILLVILRFMLIFSYYAYYADVSDGGDVITCNFPCSLVATDCWKVEAPKWQFVAKCDKHSCCSHLHKYFNCKGDGHKDDEDRVEYIVIGCHKFVTPAI